MDAQPPVPDPAAPGRRRRRAVVAASAAALLAVGGGIAVVGSADATPEPAGAAGRVAQQVHVTGTLVQVPGDPLRWKVYGDLVGDYTILHQKVDQDYSTGTVHTQLWTGQERIVGYLDTDRDQRRDASEPRGTVWMDFQQLATTDGDQFVSGYCVHPIFKARRDFAGGTLTMSDAPTGQGAEVRTTYNGYLTLR